MFRCTRQGYECKTHLPDQDVEKRRLSRPRRSDNCQDLPRPDRTADTLDDLLNAGLSSHQGGLGLGDFHAEANVAEAEIDLRDRMRAPCPRYDIRHAAVDWNARNQPPLFFVRAGAEPKEEKDEKQGKGSGEGSLTLSRNCNAGALCEGQRLFARSDQESGALWSIYPLKPATFAMTVFWPSSFSTIPER